MDPADILDTHGNRLDLAPGHYFHLASQTKAVTATAIASLVEQHRLRWSSTPADVFPRLAELMHPALRHVTLVQLLAHRAGIRPYLQSERAVLEGAARRPRPRTAPDVVAVRLAGGSDPRQPWGHLAVDGELHPLDPHAYPRFRLIVGPAADLSLSAADYGRFLRMHLRGPRGIDDTVLRAETVQRLHRVAVAAFANAGEPRGSRASPDVILRMLDRAVDGG